MIVSGGQKRDSAIHSAIPHRCPLSPKLLSSYKSHFIGHPVPGIVQGLEKVKEKKRLGLEHSNKKGIHVKKKKEMQVYKCKNNMRTSHRNDPRARLWSMNTPWPLEMHVAGKQTNSIHPASQLPNFGIKVHLSLCPFQVLWLVSPKMECPGRWLWQLCSSPVSYCLVLEWENGVSTKKKCEYSMETCRSSYFFQQKIFTQHFKYHS